MSLYVLFDSIKLILFSSVFEPYAISNFVVKYHTSFSHFCLNWHYAAATIHTIRQVANVFNKVIICVQTHVTMIVHEHAKNPLIGGRMMNI